MFVLLFNLEVENQLDNATDSQPAQCHSVLHLLHHCIEVFPECYVRKCSDSESSEKQESSKGICIIYICFYIIVCVENRLI